MYIICLVGQLKANKRLHNQNTLLESLKITRKTQETGNTLKHYLPLFIILLINVFDQ